MKENILFDKLMGNGLNIDNPVLNNLYEENRLNFNTIKSLLQQNSILPFIGAGFSASVYPTWKRFLEETASAYPNCEENVHKYIAAGKYEEAAEELCNEMGDFRFKNRISQTFGKHTLVNQFERISEERRRLNEIFKCSIITTNYDRILENIYGSQIETVCPHTGYQQALTEKILQVNQCSLIKLHGDIEDISNIVLTETDYERVYGKAGEGEVKNTLVRVLEQILQNRSVLFLGCSLYSDRTMQVLCDSTGTTRQYYALVELPEETANQKMPFLPLLVDQNGLENPVYRERRQFLSKYHINCIWYPYGEYAALDSLLDELCKSKRPALVSIQSDIQDFHNKRKIVGRDEEIDELNTVLSTQKKIIFVTGTGGIGKTELCCSVVRRRLSENPGSGMAYIELFGVNSLELFCAKAADKLGCGPLPETNGIEDNLKILSDIIVNQTNSEYGLYIDNWEDLWIGLAKSEEKRVQLLDWLEKLVFNGIKIIVSSRERPTQYDFAIYIHSVRQLDSSKKYDRALFEDVYRQKGGRLELKGSEYDRILNNLGGHPLSIVLAATFASSKVSWESVLSTWTEAEMRGRNLRHNSLRTALGISWDSLDGDTISIYLWGLLALCIEEPDLDFLVEVSRFSRDECLKALTTLYDISIINWSKSEKIMMLPPIKEVFFQLASQEQIEWIFKSYYKFLNDLIEKASLTSGERYLSHSRIIDMLPQIYYIVLKAMERDCLSEMAEQLCYGLSNYYQFNCVLSLGFIQKCLSFAQIRERYLLSALLLFISGKLRSHLGELNEAMEQYEEAERLYRAERDDLGLANVLKSKGDLRRQLGELDDAVKQYEEAERLYRAERDNLGLANVLKSKGDLRRRLGELDDAVKQYEEAERLYRAEQNNLGLANVLQSKGDLRRRLGELDDAVKQYEEAERLYRAERDNLGLANVLQSKGYLRQRLGELDEAMKQYEEAEHLYRAERDNLGLANVLQSRGDVFCIQDSLDEATEVYEQALSLYMSEREIMGYVYTMSELCLVYSLSHEQEKAIKMIAQLNETVKQVPYEPVRNYAEYRVLQAQDILKNSLSVDPVTDNDSENVSSGT